LSRLPQFNLQISWSAKGECRLELRVGDLLKDSGQLAPN
jgi:hypothetical protein